MQLTYEGHYKKESGERKAVIHEGGKPVLVEKIQKKLYDEIARNGRGQNADDKEKDQLLTPDDGTKVLEFIEAGRHGHGRAKEKGKSCCICL